MIIIENIIMLCLSVSLVILCIIAFVLICAKKDKYSCMSHCLQQWKDNRDYKILYNGSHVIIIEKDGFCAGYIHLDQYGYKHLCKVFELPPDEKEILLDYFIAKGLKIS